MRGDDFGTSALQPASAGKLPGDDSGFLFCCDNLPLRLSAHTRSESCLDSCLLLEQSINVTALTNPDAEANGNASSLLRTLLLCDLVDSTALVERMGDLSAAELIRKHDRLARTLADRHGGREIDKTDGFMIMFDRPVQAVAFALDYQRGLKQLNASENSTLAARVGIHVGDVVVWDNSAADIAKGAKPVEVEGLVKPVTSRLMSLALPGQILLSNIAYLWPTARRENSATIWKPRAGAPMVVTVSGVCPSRWRCSKWAKKASPRSKPRRGQARRTAKYRSGDARLRSSLRDW